MRKILILCLIIIGIRASAQDVIILKNTEEIKCKVFEITTTEVKYKRTDNPDGPLVSTLKSDVFMIKYANGKTESFTNIEPAKKDEQEDLFIKGKKDADKYYTHYKKAAGWTLATTLVAGGLIGLIPAAACSTTEPKEINLDYPSSELYANQRYSEGYRHQSKRKKSEKVWTNFAIGVGVNILAFIILTQ